MRKIVLSLVLASLSSWAGATTNSIWSVEPESAPAWASPDPYFGSASSNPLDVLHGVPVSFQGIKHAAPQETLPGGASLVVRYRIDFDSPVDVITLQMLGFGDFSGGGAMRLLDSRKRVLSTVPLVGGNVDVLNMATLKAGQARGQIFFLDIFASSWDSTYINLIRVSVNALTNQCTR